MKYILSQRRESESRASCLSMSFVQEEERKNEGRKSFSLTIYFYSWIHFGSHQEARSTRVLLNHCSVQLFIENETQIVCPCVCECVKRQRDEMPSCRIMLHAPMSRSLPCRLMVTPLPHTMPLINARIIQPTVYQITCRRRLFSPSSHFIRSSCLADHLYQTVLSLSFLFHFSLLLIRISVSSLTNRCIPRL